MRCPNCESDVDQTWTYCPKCGIRMNSMGSFLGFPVFEDISHIIDKEFERMRKMMSAHDDLMNQVDTGKIRGQGIRIKVTKTSDDKPNIEVKTFGDYKGQEEEIRERLGVEDTSRRMPEVTEEPKHEVRRTEDGITFTVKVPGVTDSRDFEVRQLEESIELRAFAKEKAYFTLYPIPKGARIVNKKLENEEIIIELSV